MSKYTAQKIVALALVSFAAGAFADVPWMSGNAALVADQNGGPEEAALIGYVMGVVTSQLYAGPANRKFCPPPTMTAGQASDVLIKWLREHPETRHQPTYDLLVIALGAAWPCASK